MKYDNEYWTGILREKICYPFRNIPERIAAMEKIAINLTPEAKARYYKTMITDRLDERTLWHCKDKGIDVSGLLALVE